MICCVTISPHFKNGDAILLQDYNYEDSDLGKVLQHFWRPSKCGVTVLFHNIGCSEGQGDLAAIAASPTPQAWESKSKMLPSTDFGRIQHRALASYRLSKPRRNHSLPSRIRRIFGVAVFKSQNSVSVQLSKRTEWPSQNTNRIQNSYSVTNTGRLKYESGDKDIWN